MTTTPQTLADWVLREIELERKWLRRMHGCKQGSYCFDGSKKAISEVDHEDARLEHFWRIRGKNG